MNRLGKESSPYLLQHAHNPVDWFPWGKEAFELAKKEDKLVIVSIGYSACHWCHVMEKEVFEDFECAEYMNMNFINIKVDREERPDVDHLYMDAMHLMGQRGGWPLNVFVLPDGRPVYGGTYFPKKGWLSLLENLVDVKKNEPSKVLDYAARLEEGIKQNNILPNEVVDHFDLDTLNEVVDHWSGYWDHEYGGIKKAPKFPMPNHYLFLLEYGKLSGRAEVLDFVHHGLAKMAMGGIYDQVGGGFARYSVDDKWKVPHFEKMLYDNAQLISVYAMAYQDRALPLYKRVVKETVDFLTREMRSDEGLFYSALDADSEGVEGKFYTWALEELKAIEGLDFDFASRYFALNETGYWEHDQYILLRVNSDDQLCSELGLSPVELARRISALQNSLTLARNKRVRPGLDHKILLSWNALLIQSLAEASNAFDDISMKELAIHTANVLWDKMMSGEKIFRVRTNGINSGHAFADDFAFSCEAFFSLGLLCGEGKWMDRSMLLMTSSMQKFFDAGQGMFWFSDDNDETLVFTGKMEVGDNVLPAANSVFCRMLYIHGICFDKSSWMELSTNMLGKVLPMIDFASGYTNWLRAYNWQVFGLNQLVIVDGQNELDTSTLSRTFLPNTIILRSTLHGELPLIKDKISSGNGIYVCTGTMCHPPTKQLEDALAIIA
jgi:uncharacterized protein YyaL (SSP411 family)